MWFHRMITWVKSLFATSALDGADDEPATPHTAYNLYTPTYEPEFTRRQLLYPRDPLKTFGLSAPQDPLPLDPPLYESPKTIPLMRLSPQVDLRYDEPTQPLHIVSEPSAPMQSREPTQPAPSEPLSASLQRLSELPDTLGDLEQIEQLDELDDMTRRLLFLRRLVRQRIYNEGFALEDTPPQYRHSHGLDGDQEQGQDHDASGSQN